jgi:hypothetical protein
LSTTAVEVVRFTLVTVYIVMRIAKIRTNTGFLDPFLTYVEAAAPLAAVNGQVITFADMTGRLVPELQGNTMFVCNTACFIEGFAASGIGARKNQSRSRHRISPFRSVKADRQARRSHDVTTVTDVAGLLNRDIIAVFVREKRIGISEFHHAIELVVIPVTLPCG